MPVIWTLPDFGKVPGLELNEIQEAESESFLSFREILIIEFILYDNF